MSYETVWIPCAAETILTWHTYNLSCISFEQEPWLYSWHVQYVLSKNMPDNVKSIQWLKAYCIFWAIALVVIGSNGQKHIFTVFAWAIYLVESSSNENNKVCDLSRVTRAMLKERHVVVTFIIILNLKFQCCEHNNWFQFHQSASYWGRSRILRDRCLKTCYLFTLCAWLNRGKWDNM